MMLDVAGGILIAVAVLHVVRWAHQRFSQRTQWIVGVGLAILLMDYLATH